MTISASAIGDALVTMLSAPSVFGAGHVADDDWSVVSTATCTAMVEWTNFRAMPTAFGNPPPLEVDWRVMVYIFVRDTGDPVSCKRNLVKATDLVLSTIAADATLQGTVEGVPEISGARDPLNVYTVQSGETWLRCDLSITARQWSDF